MNEWPLHACLVLDGREEVEREYEGAAEEDWDGGEERADEEHHDRRAAQTHEARLPRKVLERRPALFGLERGRKATFSIGLNQNPSYKVKVQF